MEVIWQILFHLVFSITRIKRVLERTAKETIGRELRSGGVSFEDRQDFLGYKSSRVTTHYSAAELQNLIEASNKVCGGKGGLALTLLKASVIARFRKTIFKHAANSK